MELELSDNRSDSRYNEKILLTRQSRKLVELLLPELQLLEQLQLTMMVMRMLNREQKRKMGSQVVLIPGNQQSKEREQTGKL